MKNSVLENTQTSYSQVSVVVWQHVCCSIFLWRHHPTCDDICHQERGGEIRCYCWFFYWVPHKCNLIPSSRTSEFYLPQGMRNLLSSSSFKIFTVKAHSSSSILQRIHTNWTDILKSWSAAALWWSNTYCSHLRKQIEIALKGDFPLL